MLTFTPINIKQKTTSKTQKNQKPFIYLSFRRRNQCQTERRIEELWKRISAAKLID